MNDTSINNFNLKIRQTPWYQEWFAQRGLDPNHVKLNDRQREELKRVVEANTGFRLPGDMKIDPAGNLNEKGGWAGLPTPVKIAIIGGATAATLGAAGAFSGAAAPGAIAGGGGSTAATAGGAALPTLASTPLAVNAVAAPTLTGLGTVGGVVGGTTAATSAAAPSLMSRIGSAVTNPRVLGGVGRMISSGAEAAAQNRGAQTAAQFDYDQLGLQRDQMRMAAEKHADSRQSDAMNKALWGQYVANYQPLQRPEGTPSRIDSNISDEARASGRLLYDQANQLMQSGKYTDVDPQITPFSQYPTQPGVMERIGSYAGPALTFVGLYDQLFGKR